jgi:hypothetical protein
MQVASDRERLQVKVPTDRNRLQAKTGPPNKHGCQL